MEKKKKTQTGNKTIYEEDISYSEFFDIYKVGYEAFFLDEDDGYSNFYKFRYLPIEKDFKLFLM